MEGGGRREDRGRQAEQSPLAYEGDASPENELAVDLFPLILLHRVDVSGTKPLFPSPPISQPISSF